VNDTLSYQTLSYEEFLELWDSQLSKNTASFLVKLLTDDDFTPIVLDEVFEFLICYCHLHTAKSIINFARALCVKLSLELDFSADASRLWHRALSTLTDDNQKKLLRLIPDDTLLIPNDMQKEKSLELYLKEIIQSAKDTDDTQMEKLKLLEQYLKEIIQSAKKEKSLEQYLKEIVQSAKDTDDTQKEKSLELYLKEIIQSAKDADDTQKEKSLELYLKEIIQSAKKEKSPEQYLKEIVQSAKDGSAIEIYNDLFNDTEQSINTYAMAESELRQALIESLIIEEILKEAL